MHLAEFHNYGLVLSIDSCFNLEGATTITQGATAVTEVTEQLSQATLTSSVGKNNAFTHS